MNILIAEDEENIRELIKEHLKDENYEIYCASNGVEALDIINKVKIDLGLFDVVMPYLDGFNLLRKVRETSNMPVIFLTARGEEMDKILGLGLGADDYIVKPFSFYELKARINAQLRRNYLYKEKIKEDNILVSRDIKVNKDECTVYKNDKLLDLSTKEYYILLLLITNKGKVFTKRQIYKEVWEDDFLFDENTIMVHLSNLRKKLEGKETSSKDYICTIRGIGYKWNKDDE